MEDRIKDFIEDLKNSIEKFEGMQLTDGKIAGKKFKCILTYRHYGLKTNHSDLHI